MKFNNYDKENLNLENLTSANKELNVLLEAWETPKPSSLLDKRVLEAFRQQKKQNLFQNLWHSSIKVPLPLAASITILFFVLGYFFVSNQLVNPNNSNISTSTIQSSQAITTSVAINQSLESPSNEVINISINTNNKYTKKFKKIKPVNEELALVENLAKLTPKTHSYPNKLFGLKGDYLLNTSFEKPLTISYNNQLEHLDLQTLSSIYEAESKNHSKVNLNKLVLCKSDFVVPSKETYKYYAPLSIPDLNNKPFQLRLDLDNSSIKQ